jgi:hypothetical protein
MVSPLTDGALSSSHGKTAASELRLSLGPFQLNGMQGDYQIFTSVSGERTIASPVFHWNACANPSMFDGAPIARNCTGACGSVFSRWGTEQTVSKVTVGGFYNG